MIIVDKALEKRQREGRPIRVGLIGAGYMGRMIAAQFLTPLVGMRLVAIANRNLDRAAAAWGESGNGARRADCLQSLDAAVERGLPAIADDPRLLCEAGNIDVLIECTGDVEFGARVALAAIAGRKHLVLVNAELDATVGPLLKVKADAAGIVLTNTDGDEPGVAMNLLRFVRTIGYRPVLAGNIKGFINRRRNPDTQREFAAQAKQGPKMITSFADGTKLSMETAILANAAGFGVLEPGMRGPKCAHVNDVLSHFSEAELLSGGGYVDYALGAAPGTGAFVVGYNHEPIKREGMRYFKMGDGPLHVFHTPYHLPHLQVAVTVARAALFGDATVAPLGPPRCDVAAYAKRDLKAGETLDGIGGFSCYGVIVNAAESREGGLLPMGLAAGCRVLRDVREDRPLTFDEVERPEGRLCDRLRREQDEHFAT